MGGSRMAVKEDVVAVESPASREQGLATVRVGRYSDFGEAYRRHLCL